MLSPALESEPQAAPPAELGQFDWAPCTGEVQAQTRGGGVDFTAPSLPQELRLDGFDCGRKGEWLQVAGHVDTYHGRMAEAFVVVEPPAGVAAEPASQPVGPLEDFGSVSFQFSLRVDEARTYDKAAVRLTAPNGDWLYYQEVVFFVDPISGIVHLRGSYGEDQDDPCTVADATNGFRVSIVGANSGSLHEELLLEFSVRSDEAVDRAHVEVHGGSFLHIEPRWVELGPFGAGESRTATVSVTVIGAGQFARHPLIVHAAADTPTGFWTGAAALNYAVGADGSVLPFRDTRWKETCNCTIYYEGRGCGYPQSQGVEVLVSDFVEGNIGEPIPFHGTVRAFGQDMPHVTLDISSLDDVDVDLGRTHWDFGRVKAGDTVAFESTYTIHSAEEWPAAIHLSADTGFVPSSQYGYSYFWVDLLEDGRVRGREPYACGECAAPA